MQQALPRVPREPDRLRKWQTAPDFVVINSNSFGIATDRFAGGWSLGWW